METHDYIIGLLAAASLIMSIRAMKKKKETPVEQVKKDIEEIKMDVATTKAI